MKRERERELADIDIFAEPVSLRFDGRTHYQTSVGGICTLCYLIVVVFVTCVLAKALVVGTYLNY